MIKQLEDYDCFSEGFATLNRQRHQMETGGARCRWLAWLAASPQAKGTHLADTDLGSPAPTRQAWRVNMRLLCPGQQDLKGLADDEGSEATDAAAIRSRIGDRQPPCHPVSRVHHRPTRFVPPDSSSLPSRLSQAGPPSHRSSSPGIAVAGPIFDLTRPGKRTAD